LQLAAGYDEQEEEESMKVGKLLVPLDGSPLAETALGPALDFVAGNPDATIIVMRAAEATTLPGGDLIANEVRVVHEAEEYLEGVASRLTQRGAKRVKTSVWYGPAPAAIVEAVDANKPDLIVMSSHGRSGLGRLFMGSVAESVLRATHTPILMLRPDGAPVERPRGSAQTRSRAETTDVREGTR
jgi:nucleotide-binding universal stress UspA family protein